MLQGERGRVSEEDGPEEKREGARKAKERG
jgi:hypothetical protein